MSINQHYKLSDATAVLHFIVGYNNEMEVQKKKRQQSKTEWERQRERERQSKADAATRRITFLLKCEKPFAVVAVYTRCLSPLFLPHCTPCALCLCCPLYRCFLSALCMQHAARSLLPCALFMRLSLCLSLPLAVYRSPAAVGTALCMQKT